MPSRIATHTLGCKLNFAETSALTQRFVDDGWTAVDFGDEADLYVINTCTVTAIAEKKCRNAIRQAVATNPAAIVAVIGCFAQNAADEIARIEGVDIILGNDQKHNLLAHVRRYLQRHAEQPDAPQAEAPGSGRDIDTAEPRSFQPDYSRHDRTRTFFKVQDGCDYFCTYCAIPFARGRSRSATVAETVAVARQIAASGAKEVVLTGVNTGTFGQQHGESFYDLVRALDEVEGIERYRISSIEPNLLTDDIITFCAHSRAFLPHFHIPLQAGSDKVLRLMHRRYDTQFYAERLHQIKQLMPDACIAADVMVGFNGEDDAEFERVKAYIDSLPISYLHVFTFSERPGTAVLRMEGRIDVHHRREHSRQLHDLSLQKKSAFYESQRGKSRPVLWESDIKQGMMYGFTDNYIRVRKPYNPTEVNRITPFLLADYIDADEVFENSLQG